LFAVTVDPFGRFEVTDERWARFDGDDQTAVLPDLFEETCDQLSPFGGQGLGLPEAREVGEKRFGWRAAISPRSLSANRFSFSAQGSV
jgi:hypothetical protein